MIERIGRYRVKELLGEGGMGTVYRVYDPSLDRDVALKALAPQLAQDPLIVRRFEEEARALARIEHPNVMRVYAVGQDGGKRFFAMELVRGRTLEARIRDEGPMGLKAVEPIFRQLISAVAEIHRAGIVHRDIKSSNIIIEESGRVILMDFGLAKSRDRGALTTTGSILGTPEYMAPEQATGDPVDGRADIYSLGIVFFEVLAGRPPFEGENTFSIIRKQVEESAASILTLRPDLPESCDRALRGALAKKPEHRYRDAAELAEAMEEVWSDAKAAPARRPKPSPDDVTRIAPSSVAPPVEAVREARPPAEEQSAPEPPAAGRVAAPSVGRPVRPLASRVPAPEPQAEATVAPGDRMTRWLIAFGVAAGLTGLALILLRWSAGSEADPTPPKAEEPPRPPISRPAGPGAAVEIVLSDGTRCRAFLLDTVVKKEDGKQVMYGKFRLEDGKILTVRLEDPPGVRSIGIIPKGSGGGGAP